jgi:hypothetical protein
VGFDPTRKHKRSAFDYWFASAGFVAIVALLAWVLLT